MKKQDNKTSPPVKVVGFRVEGVAPSPQETSLADAAGGASTAAGSPSPVIIPPNFAVRPPPPASCKPLRGKREPADALARTQPDHQTCLCPRLPPFLGVQGQGHAGGSSGSGDATPTMRGASSGTPGSSTSGPFHMDEDSGSGPGLPSIRTEAAAQGLDPDSFAKGEGCQWAAQLAGGGWQLPLCRITWHGVHVMVWHSGT